VKLQVAQEISGTEAEGPGRRYAIWLQGCPLRCKGCCNPEMLPFVGGAEVAVDALAARVLATNDQGISLLGGEPFAQAEAAAALARAVRRAGRSVVVFSGYTLEELRGQGPGAQALLAATDLLIDGRYEATLPDARRRWIGSTNQRMHALTDRYDPSAPSFFTADTVELRLVDGVLTANGRPWGRGLP